MLLRSHSEQDSGQVSLQDLHVGVTKSQLQRDEELGCVAVQQPGSIFRSSGALAFLGHRNSFENTSGTAGGTQKACDHPLEWQPPWRWAAERGTMGRIWPTVKKDEVAQAQPCCSPKKTTQERPQKEQRASLSCIKPRWEPPAHKTCKPTCSLQKPNLGINNRKQKHSQTY